MRDPHDLAIAQSMAASGTAPDQGVCSRFEIIIVIRQAGDVYQALYGQFAQSAEQAKILYSDDDGVECLADMVLQVREQFDTNQLAFGGLRAALGPRAMLSE